MLNCINKNHYIYFTVTASRQSIESYANHNRRLPIQEETASDVSQKANTNHMLNQFPTATPTTTPCEVQGVDFSTFTINTDGSNTRRCFYDNVAAPAWSTHFDIPVCSNFTSTCSSYGTGIIHRTMNSYQSNAGTYSSTTWKYVTVNNLPSLQVRYTNGDWCSAASIYRVTTVVIMCDITVSVSSYIIQFTESATCVYTAILKTSDALVCSGLGLLWNIYKPTLSPTNIPTSPTYEPSSYPTSQPTISPTTIPTTMNPSSMPSYNPTPQPTTDAPTSYPTTDPSLVPSLVPTSQPTILPSCTPTVNPTSMPSYNPSSQPTMPPKDMFFDDGPISVYSNITYYTTKYFPTTSYLFSFQLSALPLFNILITPQIVGAHSELIEVHPRVFLFNSTSHQKQAWFYINGPIFKVTMTYD